MIVEHTNLNGERIEIDFDDLQYHELDRVDHSFSYEARGYGTDNKEYSAICVFTCGEYDYIEGIELA